MYIMSEYAVGTNWRSERCAYVPRHAAECDKYIK